MLTVMIVEDEPKSNQLIQQLIPWEELDLQLIGACANGRAAFEFISRSLPAIVITDIRMPEMDGIELVSKVRQAEIPCEFIIISGYSQFEYAQSAVHLNVNEYLLKPIQQEELVSALRKVIEKQKSAHLSAGFKRASMGSTAGVSALHTAFMEQYTTVGFEDIASESINYGLNLQSGLFQVFILHVDASEEDFRACSDKLISEIYGMLRPLCYEVIAYAKKDCRIFTLCNYSGTVDMPQTVSALHSRLCSVCDFPCTIGAGMPQASAAGLADALFTATCAIRYALLNKPARCYLCDESIFDLSESVSVPSGADLEKLLSGLERLDGDAVEFELCRLIRQLGSNPSPTFLSSFFMRLTDFIVSTLHGMLDTLSEESMLEGFSVTHVCLSYLLTGQVPVLLQWCKNLLAKANEELKKQGSRPVHEAKLYIDKNFAHQISLEEISQYVHLSPAYFSTIFKKETSQCFSDYVTLRRIQAAKQLLRTSQDSIAAVGEAVGYSDNRYFSRIFTKIVGCKPSQYRKFT